jgi:hypothetical protein
MSAKVQWVADDVWARLDPRAGAVSRTVARRYKVTAVVAALVMAAFVSTWKSGLIWAQVGKTSASGGQNADPAARTITTDVEIRNDGWRAVGVESVGSDGPGLKVLSLGHPLWPAGDWRIPPFYLKPGETATVSITYQITDCAAVPKGWFPITVRLRRFWGTQTVDLTMDRAFRATRAGQVAPIGPEWQRELADRACGGAG